MRGRGGLGGRGVGDGGFDRRRATVGAGEVTLDAIAARDVAIAADFACTTGQAGFTLAWAAANGIDGHGGGGGGTDDHDG